MLDRSRVVPHAFVRSALFSSRKFSGEAVRAVATEANPIAIAALDRYALQQVAGERLDQGDCEVYVWLLNRAYLGGLPRSGDARIRFARGEALSGLGRARGTQSFKLLEESLLRLYRADVAYEIPHASGRTRLISSLEKTERGGDKGYDYEVVISAKAGDFLRGRDFKALLDAERKGLGDYLAKWLHGFYASHEVPFQITTDKIKQLSDRDTMQESKWRAVLEKSLAKVKQATGWEVCEVREFDNASPKIVVVKGKRLPRASLKTAVGVRR